jgi:uncharacterized protein with PQ loop repeat
LTFKNKTKTKKKKGYKFCSIMSESINEAANTFRANAGDASRNAAALAKQSNLSQGFLIFAIIVSIYFITFASLSINEGVKSPEKDLTTNKPLATISIITMILSFILIMIVPVLCVSRSKDNPTSTSHTYGASYTTLVVSLFMAVLSILALLASYDTPNSDLLNTSLKFMGGIGVFASLLVFIFSVLAITGTTQV